MLLIGLTGGIATGKSTVSVMFTDMGVPVIDADLMARRVVEPGRRALKRIRETFGDGVINPDGTMNRAAVADIIFENAEMRKKLNKITHPEIFREICWEIVFKFLKGHKFVILDLPLLFESGMWTSYLKKIIVVTCEQDLQIQRLMQRSHLSETEAIARINAQMSMSEKCSKADYIIENSGSLEDTSMQVQDIYDELNSSKSYLKIRVSALVVIGVIVGGVSCLITWISNKYLS